MAHIKSSKKPESPQTKPTTIYSDVPACIEVMRGGKIRADPDCSMLVHWATPLLHNPEAEGELAVRWGYNGQRVFESEGGRHAVDEATYIIFNSGQRLSTTIESPTSVECYTAIISKEIATSVLRGLVTPADHLLDVPHDSGQPVEFLTTTHPHDDVVSPVLFRLEAGRAEPGATHSWFEQQFHELAARLLKAHRNVLAEVAHVPGARAATRAETYRRLHRARDYMESALSEPLTIGRIAEAAWLSPYHFLRLFKQAFGETPHQYLTRRRIDHAKRLLTASDISVTDVCLTVGFESLGSFSWLFRRLTGASPEQYRREARRFAVSL